MTGRPVTGTPCRGLVRVEVAIAVCLHDSHAQPEPKRVAPALAKACLKASNPPSSASIAAASWPVGRRRRYTGRKLWLACPPPLLRTACLGFGHSGEIADDFAKAFLQFRRELRSAWLRRRCGVWSGGFPRTGIEAWFERVVGVVQCGQFVVFTVLFGYSGFVV